MPTLAVSQTGTNTVMLSWPESITGFALQAKATLSDPNPAAWVPVTAPIAQVNGLNQAVIPATTGTQFYRLILN